MKIMTVFGSPRAKGNTAKVLGWVEEKLEADGHEVGRANVVDYRIAGCVECYSCKRENAELCAIDDDANGLYRRMIDADLVLLAAPLFCWGFPAQMKALIDRMFCLADDATANPDYDTRIKGKPLALLVTSAGPIENNADILAKVFDALVDYLKARNAGHLLVPFCTTPDALGDDAKAKAVAFAKGLA